MLYFYTPVRMIDNTWETGFFSERQIDNKNIYLLGKMENTMQRVIDL